MKTHALLARALTAAALVTMLASVPLVACQSGDSIPFTGTDLPTGPMIGEMPPILPDADGVIRVRDVPLANCRLTFCVPWLGREPVAVDVEFIWNANIDTAAGPGWWTCWGECRGYITDAAGNRECVMRGYYHSRRSQVSDTLWLAEAEWLGTFCAGPLEGIAFKATEICESWDPMMVAGYDGRLIGVLIVPDSFDRPRPRQGPIWRR